MTKNKKVIGLVVLSVIVIMAVAWGIIASRSSRSSADGDLIENEEVIPTVDSSVKVELTEGDKKGEVTISIKNAPAGSKKAEIELNYNRKRQPQDETVDDEIPDGALSSCTFKGGSRNCTKEGITLGTCSSGVCRYHQVVGKIKLTITFEGSYGKRLFTKEYEL